MATSCLGIAIDHRVRRLIKPTTSSTTREKGAHQNVLNARGRECKRSRAEIDVTAQLAGPSTRGGIAVALQQPRDNHPFQKGLDAVIDDCATLAALDELFAAASGGTLSIRKNVSVIDLMPYVSETEMNTMTDQQLKTSFETTTDAFCEKQPDVVLCAGKIRLPRERKFDDRKGEIFKIESAGIGKTFGRYTVVRLRAANRSFIPVYKVNGFHLSYALNYRAHYSCLRQLQLLTVVEACTQARTGNWEDEAWMQGLRDACARVVEATNSPASSPRSRKTSAQPQQSQRPLYLPDYEKLYSSHLQEMKSIILSFFSSGFGSQYDSDGLYDRLLNSRLSSLCNDASLILFEMSKLEAKGWDARFDQWNLDTLRKAAQSTISLTEKPKGSAGHAMGSAVRLKTILNHCLVRIASTIDSYGLDLKKASVEFLGMAIDIESFLLKLLEEETSTGKQVYELGPDLAVAMGGMSLGARSGPAVTVTPARRRYEAQA